MKLGISRILLATVALLASLSVSAETLTLKSVMQQLGKDLAEMNHGILIEDYATIERTAMRIAEHPKPALVQRKAIMAKLGPDTATFKEYDGIVHNSAKAISEAAKTSDMLAIMEQQQQLFNGCIQCHSTFRPRLATE